MPFKCHVCSTEITEKDRLPFVLEGKTICSPACYFSRIWTKNYNKHDKIIPFKCWVCSSIITEKDTLPFVLEGKTICSPECYFKKLRTIQEPYLSRVHSESTLEIPSLKREFSWYKILNTILKFPFVKKDQTIESKDNIV